MTHACPASASRLANSAIVTRSLDVGGVAVVKTCTKHELLVEQWQRVDTAIYWHVEPTLDFSGPNALTNRQQADSLVSGRRAQGRALILMAVKHTNMGTVVMQASLFTRVHGVRLRDNSTIAQLMQHTMDSVLVLPVSYRYFPFF